MKKIWIVIWSLVNFAFSGFLAQPLTDFVKRQFSEESTVSLGWLLDNRFSLLYVVIFIVLFLAVVGLIVWVWYLTPGNRRKRKEQKIQSELKKFNSMYFQDYKIRATWEVVTEGLLDDNPFITNLQLFCLNEQHQPVRMQNGMCPHQGCPNHIRRVYEYKIKNQIESELILKKQSMRSDNN